MGKDIRTKKAILESLEDKPKYYLDKYECEEFKGQLK